MRKITDHVVEGDSMNHQLEIIVTDEPSSGANHEYVIQGIIPVIVHGIIKFQNGPIREVGVNGLSQEALLAIVIDRLRSFQSGPLSCRDNAIALTHIEEALMWLQRRTRERIKRGVEGTGEK